MNFEKNIERKKHNLRENRHKINYDTIKLGHKEQEHSEEKEHLEKENLKKKLM